MLLNTCTSFGLDEIIRKVFECSNEDLPKLEYVPPTEVPMSIKTTDIQKEGHQAFVAIVTPVSIKSTFLGVGDNVNP